jgi:hypothetical protein
MKRILFLHSQTLHAKVTIPLALCFASHGYGVSYLVNLPTFFGRSFGFSARYIRANPTGVRIINPEALQFVARLVGYGDQWSKVRREIGYHLWRRFGQFDAIIATSKNIPWLRSIRAKHGTLSFAVGYEHIPFAIKIDDPFRSQSDPSELESVFLTDNAFSQAHRLQEILQSCGLHPCGFTYLDKVYQRYNARDWSDERFVLVFHPGGYRRVITEPGDPRAVCYAKQRAFLERLCVPLLQAGFKPVVKIHPLRAKFHDLADVQGIVKDIVRENGLDAESIICIGPESWYWDYAFRSSFILTSGSSSIYELWSVGLRNVFVCDFEGSARSQKFRFFDSICIDSYEEYLDFISTEAFRHRPLDELTAQAFDAYHGLFNGQATQTAYELISNELQA